MLQPMKLPAEMPARQTPMMLVQVYSETPMNGASMRPATSSSTIVQQLAMKTISNETQSPPIDVPILSLAAGRRHTVFARAGVHLQEALLYHPPRHSPEDYEFEN